MLLALSAVLLVAPAAALAWVPGNYFCPVVTTAEGKVKGRVATSVDGHFYCSFKGVPYAQPPTGNLRFRPPRRHPGWEGVLHATEHGSECAQIDFSRGAIRVGSEDCLFANVYTRWLPFRRNSRRGRGLPVMVFVHGGGFFFGRGDSDRHGPDYLMDEEVVLVTFNYRLGVFGFLTTHDAAAPGNYGMLDQVLLLEWVRDNIAAFGGDPQRVTVFGQSAGGASVSLLVLSPLTKGLFQHAISQSGASLTPFAASGWKLGLAQGFAQYLNCSTSSTTIMIDCIRSASEDELMNASLTLQTFMNAFRPRVDSEAEVPFLPKDPRLLLESGEFNLVPWINGVTEEEGLAFAPLVLGDSQLTSGVLSGVPEAWGVLALISPPSPLDCGADQSEVNKVLDFYSSDNITVATIARVMSDRLFIAPISEEIRLASAHAPVYKYLLDHRGAGRQQLTWLQQLQLPDLGVTHEDDLLYLFTSVNQTVAQPGTPAYTMVRFMVSLWTNFARTGRPNSEVLPMPDWPIFTEESQRYLRLNSEPSLAERLFEERANFWQTVAINEPWRHPVQTACEPENAAETVEHSNVRGK